MGAQLEEVCIIRWTHFEESAGSTWRVRGEVVKFCEKRVGVESEV